MHVGPSECLDAARKHRHQRSNQPPHQLVGTLMCNHSLNNAALPEWADSLVLLISQTQPAIPGITPSVHVAFGIDGQRVLIARCNAYNLFPR